MSKWEEFRVATVREVFGGKAVYIALSGDQSGVDATVQFAKLTDWLFLKGKTKFVLDLRQARYPDDAVDRILARAERILVGAPPYTSAIVHQGEHHYALQQMLRLNMRLGNAVKAVRSVSEARSFLVPRTASSDVAYIEDFQPVATARR
ncbi:hypothetical protein [Maricaulis sp.]|uniref:hypothetical protein n=1 Tax=Maricaulis sp. TaxID=1486257 RepID=UPI00262740D5|nr:hypothetical protein [Maricaulis sp.]